ncbi:MAG: neutral amino acid transporter [Stictis urceolatum]|nr:neutral amino acid transporter [Stictis urceolata]
MQSEHNNASPSKPQAVPGPRPPGRGSFDAQSGSNSRATSTARLASPVQSSFGGGTSAIRQIPTPAQLNTEPQTPLAGAETGGSSYGPGRSALAAALESNYGRSPPRFGTPPVRPTSPATGTNRLLGKEADITGSFDAQHERRGSTPPLSGPNSDHEVVRRHLVRPSNESLARPGQSMARPVPDAPDLDEFSSLQLKGGDVHRGVYRWAEEAEAEATGRGKGKRSKSFSGLRPELGDEELDIQNIKAPGGFRRNYLRRSALSPSPSGRYGSLHDSEHARVTAVQPRLFTNNFIEFLTLYGHFAGEELEDDDELGSDDYSSGIYGDDEDDDRELGEGSSLLASGKRARKKKRSRKSKATKGTNTPTGAVLLLLKSFVGTGVLFLPRAFLNGGMLFSSLVLLGVAALSYYCFILLVTTRLNVEGSFGDMGGILYGKPMRSLILASIVLSQIGFVAAYIVFTSENLQAFIVAVSHCKTWIDIKFMVLMQLIIFLPLSLIRDISKLSFTALVADFFIMLGLIYLYYYDIATVVDNHGVSDIVNFNSRDWTLFIGTAIFTFEGIGLIIPIQESMKQPAKFPPVLAFVMVIITIIFTSMGAISYAAFGSSTKTVVLLNLPQDSKFVNGVQFLYSLAILLSTPLQLFPAIRILETELFTRSGKYNPWIKWRKNLFRFLLVILCAAIAWGGAGDLDKFVSLVGSFACVPLVYVYPLLQSQSGDE